MPPVLMTPAQLEDFIAKAKPGERAPYYVGDLAYDRVHDRHAAMISRSADYAADHAVNERYRMSSCSHVRTVVVGSGELSLVRQKIDDGRYAYYAVKR